MQIDLWYALAASFGASPAPTQTSQNVSTVYGKRCAMQAKFVN